MVVPPLPVKGGVLSLSASALAERIRALALFAERLARVPPCSSTRSRPPSSAFRAPRAEDALRFETALRVQPRGYERSRNPRPPTHLLAAVQLPDDPQDIERLAVQIQRELRTAIA